MTEQAEKTVRNVTGRVVSNKMDKTITVLIERRVPHPLYRKYVRRSTKLHAHDEKNECREGDKVMIVQSRPISKTKAWRLVKIVERGEEV
jgi:small subunit ribosomal protein S17